VTKIIYETHANGHWKELFKNKNKLLGGHNLEPDEEICAVIEGIGSEQVYDRELKQNKDLVVVNFSGGKIPPMVLNVTNMDTIARLHGNKYADWAGKKILIHTVRVRAFGKEHDALRIRERIPRDDDLTPYINKLKGCKTMQDLQSVFMGMPKHIQGATSSTKDEMKVKLSCG